MYIVQERFIAGTCYRMMAAGTCLTPIVWKRDFWLCNWAYIYEIAYFDSPIYHDHRVELQRCKANIKQNAMNFPDSKITEYSFVL